MLRATTRLIAAGLCAAAGSSLWVSLGTLAVPELSTTSRIMAMPPLWLLGVLTVAPGVAAWLGRLDASRSWPLLPALLLWLPYVPGQVPGAFLIWQGPIEGLVWIVVGAGCLATTSWRVPGGMRAVAMSPRAAPRVAALLAAICYGVSAVALRAQLPEGDEPHYLVIAQSLLNDGDLQIENNHRQVDYAAYARNELPPDYLARGKNGEIYSSHPIGAAIVALPGFALFGYAGASATVVAIAAATSGLGWRLAWLVTGSAGAAWFAWAAVFLTAPFLLKAFTVFPDAIAGLPVLAAVWVMARANAGTRPTQRALWTVGAALATVPWIHPRLVPVAATVGVLLAVRLIAERQGMRRFIALVGLPVVSGIAWFAFFQIIWGTIDPRAPIGGLVNSRWSDAGFGLTGLLLDQRFGLLPAAPVYLGAFAGMLVVARQRPRLAAEVAVVALPYTVMLATYDAWWGGFGAPARYFGALLPLAALPLALLWATGRTLTRAWLLCLLTVSLAGLVCRLLAGEGVTAFAERLGPDAFLDRAARSVMLTEVLPSVRGAFTWRDTAALTAALLAAWGLPALLWRRRSPSAGAAWAIVSCAAASALMASAALVWTSHQSPGVSPLKSQLAFVSDWRPERQPFLLRPKPPYVTSVANLLRRIDVALPPWRDDADGGATGVVTAPVIAPADYEIVLGGEMPLHGRLDVVLGDTPLSTDGWRLDDLPDGRRVLPWTLAVAVGTLTFRADADARHSIRDLRLRVRALRPEPVFPRAAKRVVRYGGARAFFLDDNAYPEGPGFWTVGESTMSVVIERGDPSQTEGQRLTLQSGPVPTSAELRSGAWLTHRTLAAHERVDVTLPAAGREVALSIRSGLAFLPVRHDPANRDFRHLGVWVELH